MDSAIGGMAEGSRIVSPDEYGKKTEIPKVPDTRLSPLDTSTKVSTGAQAGGTMQGVMSGAGQEGVSAGGQTSVTIGGTGEGNIDTSGGIGGGTTAVEEQPIGSIEGPGETGGGGITEPEPVVGTTPETGGSLIDIDANVGIDNGGLQTDVNVGLDTEQRDQILDADVGAGAGEAGGVTGGTDITARDISPDSELPPEITESAISSGTDIGTEVDTSGSSVGNEADIGVEADVEGGGEGDDLANDPADGLPGL